MIIDISDIVNYSICPMRYKLSKEINNDENIAIKNKYENVVRKTIFSYFASIQNNEKADYKTIKRVFGNLWIGEKSVNDLIFSKPVSWRNQEDSRRKKGINSFYKFNEVFSNDIKYPVLINYKYKIEISKNIFITGTIDLIRDNDDGLELISFRTDDTSNDIEYISKCYKITTSSLAFNKLFNEKLNRTYCYGFNKGTFNIINKNDKNFNDLEKNIINISKCIYNKIIYKSVSNLCSKCDYKNKCL